MARVSPNALIHRTPKDGTFEMLMNSGLMAPAMPIPAGSPSVEEIERKFFAPPDLDNIPEESSKEMQHRYNLRRRSSTGTPEKVEPEQTEKTIMDLTMMDILNGAGSADDPSAALGRKLSVILEEEAHEDNVKDVGVGIVSKAVLQDKQAPSLPDTKKKEDNNFLEECVKKLQQLEPKKKLLSDTVQVDQDQSIHGVFNSTLTNDADLGKKAAYELKAADKLFAPVDVYKGQKYVYVTSQCTSAVAVFEGPEFKGVLKMKDRHFRLARNVVCAKVHMNENTEMATVFVLDAHAIFVFKEISGQHVKTFLSGHGFKYRGLDIYRCYKHTTNGVPTTYLVTLDVSESKKKKGVAVCTFTQKTLESSSTTPDHRFEIVGSATEKDPKCRFVAVANNCSSSEGGPCSHIAYVTGIESHEVYKIDLNTGESGILQFKIHPGALDLTHCRDAETIPSLLGEPTGVRAGKDGYFMVADRFGKNIYSVNPDGVVVRAIDFTVHITGFYYSKQEKVLYVADNPGKRVLVYQDI